MAQTYDHSKPFSKLRTFALALGWRGLEMWQLKNDGVTWYQTCDPKFFLQINEHPIGQVDTYAAAVYADRYGICTGFHTFALANHESISALMPWLQRSQFKSRQWRRAFCTRHPECCINSPTCRPCRNAKRRSNRPPYFPDDPKPAP